MEYSTKRIYVVDIEESVINRLDQIFYDHPQLNNRLEGYAYNFVDTINDSAKIKSCDVIIISAFLPDQMGVDLIPKVKRINPKIKVIALIDKNTRSLSESCKDNGADQVLQKPFSIASLLETINTVLGLTPLDEEEEAENAADATRNLSPNPSSNRSPNRPQEEELDTVLTPKRRTVQTSFDPTPTPFSAPMQSIVNPFHSDLNPEEAPQSVIAFYATSSAGKTSILVNVAAAIKKNSVYNPRICIVDFNLIFPSVVYKMDTADLIDSTKNIYDIFEDFNHLNEGLIKQTLITHAPTDIKIINTPTETIRSTLLIRREGIEHLIQFLKTMFDVILIDTSSHLQEDATIVPITIADKTVVLLEPDVSSLLQTRKFMDTVRLLESNFVDNHFSKRMLFVLNKDNAKTGIDMDNASNVLNQTPVRFKIPDDPSVTFYGNNGQFVVDSSAHSATYIQDLARALYPFDKDLYIGDPEKTSKTSNSIFISLAKKIHSGLNKKK